MQQGDRNITAAVPGLTDKDILMRSWVKWLSLAAVQSELSFTGLQQQLGPWQWSARINSIIKQAAAVWVHKSHRFSELLSSAAVKPATAKCCWICCFWDTGVQVGEEHPACFHLHWGSIAQVPPHAPKSRFSVEFLRMQEAKETEHEVSVSLL